VVTAAARGRAGPAAKPQSQPRCANFSAMIGTVHAALIASPQLSGFRAAAKQWRD